MADQTMTMKQWLESYRELLRTAPDFQCACCHFTRERKYAGDVHVFEGLRPDVTFGPDTPLAAMAANKKCLYVLCAECEEMDPALRKPMVMEWLGNKGLFD